VGAARRRKKLSKLHLTNRATPGTDREDEWEAGVGAATAARYDKKWFERERVGQLRDNSEQAPVKYNRCKHCNHQRHCVPDLWEMRIRLNREEKERQERESQSGSLE
jgi:hypothetical protein